MLRQAQHDNCGKAGMLRQAQHDKRRAFDPNGKQVLRPPLSAKQRLEAMVRCLMTFLSAEMLRQAQHDNCGKAGMLREAQGDNCDKAELLRQAQHDNCGKAGMLREAQGDNLNQKKYPPAKEGMKGAGCRYQRELYGSRMSFRFFLFEASLLSSLRSSPNLTSCGR